MTHGHFGVERFCVISGFVVFISLGSSRSATDFAATRSARLLPAYWAALLLTSRALAAGGLPDRALRFQSTLFNLTMLQEFFGIRHVDGLCWTRSRERGNRAPNNRREWLLLAATVICELLLPRPDGRNPGHLSVLSSIGAVWMATTGRSTGARTAHSSRSAPSPARSTSPNRTSDNGSSIA